MGPNVLGHQSHILQRSHTTTADGHEGYSHLSPVLALRILSRCKFTIKTHRGRVFLAGVAGPSSPSRDAVSCLSYERFSRSVETRRRYFGWLRMLFSSALLPSSDFPSGGGGTREASGSTVAMSLVALYRVGTHQIRRGRKAADSARAESSSIVHEPGKC